MDEQNNLPVEEPVVTEVQPRPVRPFWGFIEKNFLALSILTAGIMISSSVLYSNGTFKPGTAQIVPNGQVQQPGAKVDVSADDDAVLGNKNAKVTIIEFSDYQCPFCRTFWKDSLSQIIKDYVNTGKAKFIYRDYPLSFHPMAVPSAQAAECADDQGKYWDMHDKMFSEQTKLGQGTVTYTVQDLKKWAVQIGLDANKFNQCLDSGKYKAEVEKDFADGQAAGVSGTPTTFINGRSLVGAQPYATFKAIIEEELNKK